MKRFASLLALLFTASVLTACGSSDPHEAVVEDMVGLMEDVESALKGVKDKDSAEKVGEKFEAIGEKLNKLIAEMDGMEPPSAEKEKELREKYEPMIEEMKESVEAEMKRIAELGVDVIMTVGAEIQKIEPDKDMPSWID
ncbi:MAG: hypothetical protein AAGB26_09350 [Planctomycetota bacterium]